MMPTSKHKSVYWVVGAGGSGGTPPVFLSRDWPSDLAGPITNARHYPSIAAAKSEAQEASHHPLFKDAIWRVFRVEGVDIFAEED